MNNKSACWYKYKIKCLYARAVRFGRKVYRRIRGIKKEEYEIDNIGYSCKEIESLLEKRDIKWERYTELTIMNSRVVFKRPKVVYVCKLP